MDTLATGLGAVLAQHIKGEEYPILYISHKLFPCEQKYAMIEEEALAVKWALEALRYYLLESPFVIIMDHMSLCWLQQMKETNA